MKKEFAKPEDQLESQIHSKISKDKLIVMAGECKLYIPSYSNNLTDGVHVMRRGDAMEKR